MANEMRDRLRQLLLNTNITWETTKIADHLIENGVVVPQWISVKDRLPENHRVVLVVCEGTTIGRGTLMAIGSYGGGFWSLADAEGTLYLTKYMHYIVTHWMPLPELPKGCENNAK